MDNSNNINKALSEQRRIEDECIDPGTGGDALRAQLKEQRAQEDANLDTLGKTNGA